MCIDSGYWAARTRTHCIRLSAGVHPSSLHGIAQSDAGVCFKLPHPTFSRLEVRRHRSQSFSRVSWHTVTKPTAHSSAQCSSMHKHTQQQQQRTDRSTRSSPSRCSAALSRQLQPAAPRTLYSSSRLVFAALWLCSIPLLWQLPGALAADGFSQYAIDWNIVSSSSTPAYSDLRADCVCALLNSTCTPNCCCDPNCPAAVVEGFRAQGSCLPEGPAAQQLAYCTSGDPLAKVGTRCWLLSSGHALCGWPCLYYAEL